METLSLDFHPQRPQESRPLAWAALALAGVAATATAWHLVQASDELDTLRSRHDVLAARTRPAPTMGSSKSMMRC